MQAAVIFDAFEVFSDELCWLNVWCHCPDIAICFHFQHARRQWFLKDDFTARCFVLQIHMLSAWSACVTEPNTGEPLFPNMIYSGTYSNQNTGNTYCQNQQRRIQTIQHKHSFIRMYFQNARSTSNNHSHHFEHIRHINNQLTTTRKILSASDIWIIKKDKNYWYHDTCHHDTSHKCRASTN